MRILHFSDIHIGTRLRAVPKKKWLGKRAVGAANLLAGRYRRFLDNGPKLEALAEFRRDQDIDLVFFTGDYTALGLEAEFVAARRAVQPLMDAPMGYVNVPGNHDIYLLDVIRDRAFERHFGDTLHSDLPEFRADGPWPLVRLFDPSVAVVAVNSARPNPWPWRSSGRLPVKQLGALMRVLDDPRVRDRFVFVLNHYPPRLADGARDRWVHRMINDDEFLAACAELPRGAILSGHVHRRYVVRVPEVNPPLVCSGSTTMEGREGLWIYQVDRHAVRAVPGSWNGTRYELETDAAVDLSPHDARP
jgi:3',5'-cyclic AMP phosphodiesterase CpdA